METGFLALNFEKGVSGGDYRLPTGHGGACEALCRPADRRPSEVA